MEGIMLTQYSEADIRKFFRQELESFYQERKPEAAPAKRKPLSGAKAIAEHTGLAESTIYKLTALNQIPHAKRGKRLTADPDELDAWLLAGKVEPLDQPASRPNIYTRTRSPKGKKSKIAA